MVLGLWLLFCNAWIYSHGSSSQIGSCRVLLFVTRVFSGVGPIAKNHFQKSKQWAKMFRKVSKESLFGPMQENFFKGPENPQILGSF